MLALTAAAPAWRGALADSDARWDVVAASVDDRTPSESGRGRSPADPRLVAGGTRPLPRSRYSSISRYAFECDAVRIASTGSGGPHQTSELSSSANSKSIRLIFGRIDCSRRVLEAQRKSPVQTVRLCAH